MNAGSKHLNDPNHQPEQSRSQSGTHTNTEAPIDIFTLTVELRAHFSTAWKLWQDVNIALTDAERSSVERVLQEAQACLTRCNRATAAGTSDTSFDLEQLGSEIRTTEQQIASLMLLLNSYGPMSRNNSYRVSSPPPAYSLYSNSISELGEMSPVVSGPRAGIVYAELPGDAVMLPMLPNSPQRPNSSVDLPELEAGYIAYRRGMPVRQTLSTDVSERGPSSMMTLRDDELNLPVTSKPASSTAAVTLQPGTRTALTGRARSRRWLEMQASRSRG